MADYEYHSSPTEKDFDDLMKKLDEKHGMKAYIENDYAMAMAQTLVAMKELEEQKLRCTGRTTKIIDDIIQDLFTKPGTWCTIEDHHNSEQANANLFGRVLARLRLEHAWLFDSNNFEMKKNRIRLIMDPKQLKAVTDRLNGVKM